MRLSVFTTITDPENRGDNFWPSYKCYADLADELVIVDGAKTNQFKKATVNGIDLDKGVKVVHHEWPMEFSWELFGEQFQRGYEACTGDWVLRADLDYIFHEDDFKQIRKAIKANRDALGLSFYKKQFILPDRYNIKSRLVVLVNKKAYGDRIRFDGGGDMCQATFDGVHINPASVPEAKVSIYNYEKILKTREQISNDVGRMERAWRRYYGATQYKSNGSNEDAYNKWVEAQIGKFNKPQQRLTLNEHPKYIQDTILSLKPENWGYNGHGKLEENSYVKSGLRSR